MHTTQTTLTAETAIRRLRATAAARAIIAQIQADPLAWYTATLDTYEEDEGPPTVRNVRVRVAL